VSKVTFYRQIVTHHDPSQNADTSFMSSHKPENSMPELDQFWRASVQYRSVLLANQSGKMVYPGQTWPIYSEPSGFFMNTSLGQQSGEIKVGGHMSDTQFCATCVGVVLETKSC
jgi:hypothetical protein